MNVNQEDLVEMLEKVFEEGYYGYLDLKDSVVQAIISELEEKEEEKKCTVPTGQLEFDFGTGGGGGFITDGTAGDILTVGSGTDGWTDTWTTASTSTNVNNGYVTSTGGYVTLSGGDVTSLSDGDMTLSLPNVVVGRTDDNITNN